MFSEIFFPIFQFLQKKEFFEPDMAQPLLCEVFVCFDCIGKK